MRKIGRGEKEEEQFGIPGEERQIEWIPEREKAGLMGVD